jgi:hypothetical protein
MDSWQKTGKAEETYTQQENSYLRSALLGEKMRIWVLGGASRRHAHPCHCCLATPYHRRQLRQICCARCARHLQTRAWWAKLPCTATAPAPIARSVQQQQAGPLKERGRGWGGPHTYSQGPPVGICAGAPATAPRAAASAAASSCSARASAAGRSSSPAES